MTPEGYQISNDTLITVNFGMLATLALTLWKSATLYTETRMNIEFMKKNLDAAFEKIRQLEGKIK